MSINWAKTQPPDTNSSIDFELQAKKGQAEVSLNANIYNMFLLTSYHFSCTSLSDVTDNSV